MGHRAKPSKGKAEARRPPASKSPKTDAPRVHELETHLAEALEQRAALSEILQVIRQSPTDVQPVFDTIVRNAVRLCDAIYGLVYRSDGEHVYLAAHHNFTPQQLGEWQQTFPRPISAGGASMHVIRTGVVVRVADVETERDLPISEPGRAMLRSQNAHSVLIVPMFRQNEVIGSIMLTHRDVGAFTDAHVELLKTFADQAVIAIENVRLFKELEARNSALMEALDQQTATSEILSVISSSPTDVQPVLDAVAENAARLCDAEDASILKEDGEVFRVVAYHGASRLRDFEGTPVSRGSVAGRAIRDGQLVHVHDITEEAEAEFPVSKALARHFGHRTMLATPLLREGAPIGAIFVRRTQVCPFSDKQIELLQTFADQAVIAIENVRLFTELQEKNRALTTAHAQMTEALEQQTATSEVLKVISRSAFDLQPVLESLVENAVRLCGADKGLIYRQDADLYRIAVSYGHSPEFLEVAKQYPIRQDRASATGRAVLERRAVHIHDILADPEYAWGEDIRAAEEMHRTILAVPMLREGAVIGVIVIRRTQVLPFTDKQIELVTTFADQAVIAIENVRLFKELEARNTELTETLARQMATGEVLRAISQAQTDAQPVFEIIAASARRLCGAAYAQVQLYDGELIHLAALESAKPEGDAAIRAVYPLRVGDGSAGGRAIATRAVTQIPDLLDDRAYAFTSVWQASGLRSLLAVPMLRDGDPIGTIGIGRIEPGSFPQTQIDLLQTFADQAVIAIENVRLFTELQASNRELTTALDTQTATSDILRVISQSQTDVQPVFDAIVTSAVRLLQGYAGALTRIAGDQIELAALTSTDDAGNAAVRAIFPQSLQSEWPYAQAIRNRAPVNIADFQTDPRWPEPARARARVRGSRSMVVVPMLRHNEAVGTISVTRREPGGFTDDEITLLQTFADQAVIAIENVRLFKELETRNRDLTVALDQQTATSDILKVISSSPTEMRPVFETIVDSAVTLCDAAFGTLFRWDGQLITIGAMSSDVGSDERAILEQIFPVGVTPESRLIGRTIREKQVVQIEDVQADSGVLGHGSNRRLVEAAGYRTFLAVPLLRGDVCFGVINLWRRVVAPFSEQHIALLQTFADQAVIAIENARLLTELQARTAELTRSVDELTALGDVGRVLSSTLDLETVLQTIVTRANQLTGTAGCTIWEYDEVQSGFRLRASHYADQGDAAVLQALGRVTTIPKGQGVTTRVMELRQPVQIHDITTARDYESPIRRPLIEAGHRALLGVPLLSEDEVIGVLAVTRKTPGEFEPEIVRLLSTFATQSALAIQNARLFLEIEDKSRQLEAASQHKSEFLANMSHELRTPLNAIIGFSEVLTERMFGELNEKQDEYLKDIYASGQHLLSLINDILDLSKIEAGRMELELTDFHLPTALDNALTLVRERAGRRSITLQMNVDERLGEVRADERKIRQVVLNLLSNAIKFTPEGGRVEVGAVPRDGFVEVSVGDTGVGIAPEDQEAVFEEFRQVGTAEKKAEGTGLGLTLCRKFIELHGGRIWVQSQVGVGSTFTFTIPVRSAKEG